MSAPELSAVLVNYNAGDDLRHALRSIASELYGHPYEVAVVDNASTDGSQRIANEFAPWARLIQEPDNIGFGRGVNRGIAETSAPLVLIMNPDCRLEAGAIARLRAELDAHAGCAIVGPRILDPDGSVQGSARGDPDMLTGLFGRTTMMQRLLPGLAVSQRNVVSADAVPAATSSLVVDWLSGACMLARREALDAVGAFDPRFFMYWEDADLCRRLRAQGWHVRYVPGATAIHKVGQSSRTARASAIKAFHASAYTYYATHVAPGALDPRRPIARMLLTARCAMQLRGAAREAGPRRGRR